MRTQQNISSPRTVFYVATSADDLWVAELEKHLRILKHQQLITNWSGSKITPGMKKLGSLEHALNQASVILLLISPDFLASDVCNVVMRQALKLSLNDTGTVVPILLRPVVLENVPFAHLQYLPRNGRFITSWTNRDEAFVEIIEALMALFDQTSPPKLQTTLSTSSGRFIDIRDEVNRERMLKRMHAIWIEDVLDGQWLHNAVLMNPDFHEHPGAIDDPWQSVMQEKMRPERPLPPGTRITDVYDKADGALLILGEPGAGKTTLLLELTRELIKTAQRSELHPLPVFFNFASWEKKRLALGEWLVEELQSKYNVPLSIARQWVNTQQVLPLLDGLDMLSADTLPACVEVINAYRQAHNTAPIVISSRSAEYFAQPARLTLHYAVIVQPLTEQQIDLYLSSTGKLEALRAALTQDEALRTLATTPLVLSILAQTDHLLIPRNLENTDIETLRHTIFTTYVESMLRRREENVLYPPFQTRHWLAWLARQMNKHNQVIFNPGRIQPDWLTEKWGSVIYYICNALLGALLSGLALGLVGNIVGGRSTGIVTGLVGAFIGGIGFAFAARRIRLVETVQGSSVKRQTGSLLFVLVLWLLVLLTNQPGGLSGALTTLVIMLSLLPLLIGELLKELPGALLDDLTVVPPNYGLQQSARNGIRVGLIAGTSLGLLIVLFQLFGLQTADFTSYWLLVIVLGLLTGLIFGGLATLQLKGLYWLLWRGGLGPKNYVEFLDYAAKRLLLSKIGSAYMFRYPLLQEYFTALLPEQDQVR